MQAKNDDDLCWGQRSIEIKYGKQYSVATRLGQKKHWCILRMMITFVEVKGQQSSNIVNNALWLPNRQKNHSCKLRMTMTILEVKGQQNSHIVNNTLWLPNLQKPLMQAKNDNNLCGGQRSTEVIYSKLCSLSTKHGQKKYWCKFRRTMTYWPSWRSKVNRG